MKLPNIAPGVWLIIALVGLAAGAPPVHFRLPLPRNSQPSVTLAWNPVGDPDLVGYWLYWGPATHFYTNVLAVGNVTNVSLTNLALGEYYFAVTDRNTNGLESVYSNEAAWTNRAPAPVTNFLLSVSILQSSDLTNWTTFTNLGPVQATNSGQPVYWRSLISITPE